MPDTRIRHPAISRFGHMRHSENGITMRARSSASFVELLLVQEDARMATERWQTVQMIALENQ